MANEPQSAPEMLRRWSRVPVLAEDLHHDPDRRQRVIATVAATIATAHHSRRRRLLRRWAGGLAVAALIALGWGVTVRGGAAHASLSSVLGVVHLVHAGHDGAVSGASALAESDEVTTGEQASADLTLASGTRVALEGESRVQLERATASRGASDEQVLLHRGLVRVRVPKLAQGGAMRVRTTDALITVHGTAFSVEVSGPAEHSRTDVHVSEGVVGVDHVGGHVVLTAGMTWSSTPMPATVAGGAPVPGGLDDTAAEPSPPAPLAAALRRAQRGPLAGPAHRDPGTLPEQNRAFGEAMSARRRGDAKTAARLLEAFIARYPASPLLQSAYAERFRALAHLGDRRGAAREAHRYLVEFPQGFAREEASQLEQSAPAPAN